MKRILSLILCMLILLSAVACNRGATPNEPEKNDETTAEDITTEETTAEAESETEPATEPPVPPTAEITEKIIYLMEGESHALQYTVNEDENTAGDPVWSASSDAVTVEGGVVTAKKDGYAVVSAGGERTCTVRVIPREMPTVSVNTNGVAITSRETYVPCLVDVDSTNEDFCFEKVTAEIRYRGNSTYDVGKAKRPYRIKFTSKRNMLGMNEGAECRNWVLLADYFDNSMSRNSTSLSLSSAIVNEYTSDWRYVRLEINGKDLGVFLMAEQAQINENRVAIEEAGEDSPNLESGYLFELDQSSNNVHEVNVYCTDYYFETVWGEVFDSRTLRFKMENDGMSEAQIEFANKYMQNVFEIVYRATYKNAYYALDENYNLVKSDSTDPKEVISAVIDVDSLVRKFILDELVCSHDARQKSYYMHADLSENGTGLLTFSCPWDFDFTTYKWSNTTWDYEFYDPEAFMQPTRTTWYVMIFNHAWFREMVTDYWNTLYAETNGFAAQLQMLTVISEAYADDFAFDRQLYKRSQPQAEQAQVLKNWLLTRINWFNKTIGQGDYLIEEK